MQISPCNFKPCFHSALLSQQLLPQLCPTPGPSVTWPEPGHQLSEVLKAPRTPKKRPLWLSWRAINPAPNAISSSLKSVTTTIQRSNHSQSPNTHHHHCWHYPFPHAPAPIPMNPRPPSEGFLQSPGQCTIQPPLPRCTSPTRNNASFQYKLNPNHTLSTHTHHPTLSASTGPTTLTKAPKA